MAPRRPGPAFRVATTALNSRAPSMWATSPPACAAAQTCLTRCSGQHTPPMEALVCSIETARVRGMKCTAGRMASVHLLGGEEPPGPASGRNTAPTIAAAPPASYNRGCASS